MVRWWILAAALLFAPGPAPAGELRLLSYNVRGIPPVVTFLGRPGTRIPRIVEKLPAFDIALLQETFSYQDVIERCATDADCVYYHGPGRRFRWGHVVAAPVLGLCWLTPRCRLPTNSGLMTVAQPARVATERVAAERFERCWGYLIGGNDCFAAKGFVLVRTTLADGAQVDVYNTHLDAAGWRWDRTTRAAQIEELREAVAAHSAGRAVIVAGDFNFRREEDGSDPVPLARFLTGLGLVDSAACADATSDHARGLDRIYFRSGERFAVRCLALAADPRFSYVRGGKERPLSDHDALAATFEIAPRPR